MNIVTALKSYTTQYPNPIVLSQGEVVVLGPEEQEEKWKGWIWAESSTSKGWVPMQILEIFEDRLKASVLKDYSAQELDVAEGDSLEKLESLNGWTWAKNLRTQAIGWIPDEIFS